MQRQRKDLPRREEFLNAALARFAKAGYAGTSTREICADVGFVHSAIYNYFPSKEAVVLAIEEREMTELIKLMTDLLESTAGDVRLQLVEVVKHIFQQAVQRRDAWRLMADIIRSLKPKNRAIVLERRDHYEGCVRKVLTDAIAAGEIPPQDVKFATLHLFGMAEGMSGWYKRGGDTTADEIVANATTFYLRALGMSVSENTSGKHVRHLRQKVNAGFQENA